MVTPSRKGNSNSRSYLCFLHTKSPIKFETESHEGQRIVPVARRQFSGCSTFRNWDTSRVVYGYQSYLCGELNRKNHFSIAVQAWRLLIPPLMISEHRSFFRLSSRWTPSIVWLIGYFQTQDHCTLLRETGTLHPATWPYVSLSAWNEIWSTSVHIIPVALCCIMLQGSIYHNLLYRFLSQTRGLAQESNEWSVIILSRGPKR